MDLSQFRQVNSPRKAIDVDEFIKFLEDWNKQLQPILDLRLKIKEEEAERSRRESVIELNKIVNDFNWYIVPYIPAIIIDNP